MAKYAEKTTVSPDKSRAELERTLIRYGAEKFVYGYESTKIYVGFQISERAVKIILPMPSRESDDYAVSYSGYNSEAAATRAFDQHIRQRWRALFIVVKAKLESVESGIETFDEAFMAHIIMPGVGKTIGQQLLPEFQNVLASGDMPKLLEMG